MNHFFRCQKSTCNLEKITNSYVKKCFFVYHITGLCTPVLFFELCISQGYIENFERNSKNSICITVNNFAKSVNF